jgi:Do/DeqQ family serine protease
MNNYKTFEDMKKIQVISLGFAGGLIPVMLLLVYISFFYKPKYDYSTNREHLFLEASNSIPNTGESTQIVDLTYASERSVHSVVHITTKVPRQVFRDPFFEFFYGPQQPNQQFSMGAGSGVILNTQGYIVTNNHVVENAQTIEVTLNNHKKYPAKLIGTDPNTDLAVLKIEADNLTPIVLGNSDDVKIGEWVLAVGNPFDLTSTVTAGIVSAKSRNINIINSRARRDLFPIESFIQTDAAVNPGNSGGALVNVKGELIGINTAIASNTGSYSGYSFAIPVNLMRKVVGDIIEFGVVQRGFLGAKISNVTQELMDSEKLPNTDGVYLAEIVAGGAAEKAGLKAGEVILSYDGREVNSSAELLEEVGKSSPGQTVTLEVRGKNGKTRRVNLTLQNSEGDTKLIARKNADANLSKLGATFSELTQKEKDDFNVDCGIKIASLTSGKLKSLGLREGMIITKLNNKSVCSVEEFKEILGAEQGGLLLELVTSRNRREYVGFGL